MADSINDVLIDILRGQEAARRATARIEWEDDPGRPGRRAYRITGQNKAAVQGAIDARIREVDYAHPGGVANFIGPYLLDPAAPGLGYIAIGEVVLFQSEVA